MPYTLQNRFPVNPKSIAISESQLRVHRRGIESSKSKRPKFGFANIDLYMHFLNPFSSPIGISRSALKVSNHAKVRRRRGNGNGKARSKVVGNLRNPHHFFRFLR